ncbi:MAG TPA: VOC family protein [Streptosporangiaceae bacterium]
MDDPEPAAGGRLSRQEISTATGDWGWRLVLGTLVTQVPAGSLAEAADLAARLTAFLGGTADRRLSPDPRSDRLLLTVQAADGTLVTGQEVDLAHRISAFVRTLGLATDAIGAASGAPRPPQGLEIAIDALDIAAVRPFWQAVLSYTDEPGGPDAAGGLVDPLGQGPAVWFQQMDAPRPQRNRIHIDVSVPHDEARRRVEAALAAGGTLTYDAEAPAFWVLADAEGNEACVCSWQGRDP